VDGWPLLPADVRRRRSSRRSPLAGRRRPASVRCSRTSRKPSGAKTWRSWQRAVHSQDRCRFDGVGRADL